MTVVMFVRMIMRMIVMRCVMVAVRVEMFMAVVRDVCRAVFMREVNIELHAAMCGFLAARGMWRC